MRACWRLARVITHMLHGFVVQRRFARMDAAQREARIGWWATGLLRALDIVIEEAGRAPPPGPRLLVANHVSWLDVAALHACCPRARFVAKREVHGWPLVGRMAADAGTLFIERARRRDALRIVHQIAEALSAGGTVAVFPEGTTSDGRGVLPFHANMLQAALAAPAPLQPVALRYADAHGTPSAAVEYVGDTTLGRSLWRVACAERLCVRLQWLAPRGVDGAAGGAADRQTLASQLRADIETALDVGSSSNDDAL